MDQDDAQANDGDNNNASRTVVKMAAFVPAHSHLSANQIPTDASTCTVVVSIFSTADYNIKLTHRLMTVTIKMPAELL